MLHKYTFFRPCAVWLAVGTLMLTGGPVLAQGSGDPAENWAQIAPCAQLERGDERQACVDRVFRSAGLLPSVREPAQRGTAVEQPREMPRSAPPRVAAAPTPRPAPAPAPAREPAEADRIATTVSRSFDPGNRMLVIVTEEGEVWQQSESRDLGLPPRAGTAFTVERGSLGSFICRIGGGRSFRCRRPG